MTLTDFLLARIAEDEAVAEAVPALDHNYDMGGNRQDERWIFDRTLPSSADGMGNWSKHRHSPTTAAHFSRHDPARVLAECEAKRRIVGRHAATSWGANPGDPHPFLCDHCADQLWPCPDLRDLALPYADHPDYREEWRP